MPQHEPHKASGIAARPSWISRSGWAERPCGLLGVIQRAVQGEHICPEGRSRIGAIVIPLAEISVTPVAGSWEALGMKELKDKRPWQKVSPIRRPPARAQCMVVQHSRRFAALGERSQITWTIFLCRERPPWRSVANAWGGFFRTRNATEGVPYRIESQRVVQVLYERALAR